LRPSALALHSLYVRLNPRTTCVAILRHAMRRTLCLGLLAIGLTAIAGTATAASSSDGTLSIKRGDGLLDLALRGAIVGRLGRGELALEIPISRDCADLKVWGAEAKDPEEIYYDPEDGTIYKRCEFAGRAIRFRVVGKIVLEVRKGRNLHLSAVGRGAGRVDGVGGADGVWSLDGRDPRSLPNVAVEFELGTDPDSDAAAG
jgi:hypothetical protein